jgi:hypothetical protein
MRKGMRKVRWAREFQGQNTEQMWGKLNGKLHEMVRKHVPVRKVKKNGRPIWMTREVLAAVNKKKRLWKEAKNGGSMESYKEEEKRVKRLIRNAKRSLEKRLADGNGGNKRPFYAYIKRKTKSRASVGPLKDENGSTVEETEKMAELLNNFFSSVFTREDE